MGYFSNAMIGLSVLHDDPSYPSERETLRYFWEDLTENLEVLGEVRPRDPMDPEYDRYFYSDCIVHYYENPSTVQDILFGLKEIETRLQALDREQEISVFEADALIPGQLHLIYLFDQYLPIYGVIA